jgi:DNA-binding Lrp family transcriptional regulator
MTQDAALTIDALDRRLLAEIQARVPMTHRPFQAIAQKLGLGEQECLERIGRLKRSQIVERISAVFDPLALGYERALIAMQLPPALRASAAAQVLAYPGLTFCCDRSNSFSLWSSVWVPPERTIQQLAKILHQRAQAQETLVLPALHVYKSPVPDAVAQLHPWLEAAHEPGSARRSNTGIGLSGEDRRCIRLMQQDLPLIEMPFGVWAEQAETTEEALFEWGRRMEQQGSLLGMAAFAPLAGDEAAETLVAWEIPEGLVDDIGSQISRLREISHAARRPTFPGWPYAVFTLVHGDRPDALQNALRRIESVIGHFPSVLLPADQEHCRARLALCAPQMDAWWDQARLASTAT